MLQNAVQLLNFNTTGTCEKPLVPTKNQNSWYPEVEGCGIQCQNPLFTEEEHEEVHIFIAVFGSLCMACTLFTVVSEAVRFIITECSIPVVFCYNITKPL